MDVGSFNAQQDAAFIAASREAIPSLIQEVRRLREALEPFTRGASGLIALAGRGNRIKCLYCHTYQSTYEEFQHAPDCPIAVARGVVAEGETP